VRETARHQINFSTKTQNHHKNMYRNIALTLTAAAFAHNALCGQFDWPQWQGPDRTAHSKETGLLKEWPKDGPPLVWRTNGIGKGMGGIAVSRGRIYTTGDDNDAMAWLFALNESDAKLVWKSQIGRGGNPGNIFKPWGPRSTTTIDGDRLYVLSQQGDLVCFTLEGKEVWRVNYVKDFAGIMPVWGFSESPLVDGDKIICTPGAEDATLMAIEKATGKPLWKCAVPEGPTGDRGFLGRSGAAYASVIAIDFQGERQYVQLTATTLVGVAAKDGKLLWRYNKASTTHRINCSTPIYHDGKVFAASAYDGGGGLVKLNKDGNGGVNAEEVWFSRKMQNHHGGVILVDGCLYGANGGTGGGDLVCLDFKTGNVLWDGREIPERPASKGSTLFADGRLYYRTEKGTMLLIEPSPKEYLERGRFEQPDRTKEPAWTHPVIANGKLYIRDQETLFCYDVKAK
jgi:outer membrane protein assembly factor BamB